MALRDMLSKIQTDQLGDLSDIMDASDQLERDLENAQNIIAERDTKIAQLQEQTNKLYARLLLNEGGGKTEEEVHEETLEEYNDKMRQKILGGN